MQTMMNTRSNDIGTDTGFSSDFFNSLEILHEFDEFLWPLDINDICNDTNKTNLVKRKRSRDQEHPPTKRICTQTNQPNQSQPSNNPLESLSKLCMQQIQKNKEIVFSNDCKLSSTKINQITKILVKNQDLTIDDLFLFTKIPNYTNFYCKKLSYLQESDIIKCIRNLIPNPLREFSFIFSQCNQITGTTLQAIKQENISNIDRLDLSGCNQIQGKHLCALLSFIDREKLKSFSIRGCNSLNSDDISYILSFNNFKSLESIDISHSLSVTDEILLSLLKSTPKLTSIAIEYCPKITVQSLENIDRYCKDLTSIKISGMKNLTEKSIRLLLHYKHSLSTLHIGNCISFTSPALNLLLHECYNLKNLDLSECALNDYSIIELSHNKRNLKKVILINNNIGQSIIQLVQCCGSSMKMLNLSGTLIDDFALNQILNRCPKLKGLDISFCRNITSFQAAQAKKPGLALSTWGIFK